MTTTPQVDHYMHIPFDSE